MLQAPRDPDAGLPRKGNERRTDSGHTGQVSLKGFSLEASVESSVAKAWLVQLTITGASFDAGQWA